jgi:hypothetical protein
MIKVVCIEEEIIETKAVTPKTIFGSNPDEEVSYSSKTKHKRSTAPRQGRFVLENS